MLSVIKLKQKPQISQIIIFLKLLHAMKIQQNIRSGNLQVSGPMGMVNKKVTKNEM
jgi:hypothetical protein